VTDRRLEGTADDGVPTVLFLCVHNAGRSQMALGWFNHLAGDRAVAWSGGSEPATTINPSAITAMRVFRSPDSQTASLRGTLLDISVVSRVSGRWLRGCNPEVR